LEKEAVRLLLRPDFRGQTFPWKKEYPGEKGVRRRKPVTRKKVLFIQEKTVKKSRETFWVGNRQKETYQKVLLKSRQKKGIERFPKRK